MGEADLAGRIRAVRRFNRFYTERIGVLSEGVLASPFSLAEARVLYELAQRENPTASDLCRDLGLDAGYVSRLLRDFAKQGLVERNASKTDARQSLLTLTARGRRAFAALDGRSRDEIAGLLRTLPPVEQERLVASMLNIERLLGPPAAPASGYVLRPHQPGDMGWVVQRHGIVYAQEHGYDEGFEALVAGIVADFIRNYDPKTERCWMAELGDEVVGSVFLVKKSKTVAKLRLLLVEPKARGLGIGRRLVAECVRFARQAGYREMTLWTQSDLDAARHLYRRAGFRVVKSEKHHSFGRNLTAETWRLRL